MSFTKIFFRDFDKAIFTAALFIFLIGLIVLYSATQSRAIPFSKGFVLKQANWMLIGILLVFIVVNISYQKFIDISYLLYAMNVIFLILVLALGHTRLGAQRWFSIGAFAFQPAEFMKVNLILALANYIGAKEDGMASFKSLVVPILLLAVPFALVMMQPDLGTALLLLPIFFSMLLIGGAKPRHLLGMVLLGLAGAPLFWNLLRGYQRQRLLVFVNPNADPLGAGYTIIQSKIAIGSGGLFGKGWLSGTQNQLNFLPERHTDFIFSVVGEEWGFVGAIILIALYFIIIKRALNISYSTGDAYGKLIATGVAVMLALQVIINIGMTMGLMPVVGIPLPLVSYGGSSLLTSLIAIALVLNVGMRRSMF